jgi:hypothetical protein
VQLGPKRDKERDESIVGEIVGSVAQSFIDAADDRVAYGKTDDGRRLSAAKDLLREGDQVACYWDDKSGKVVLGHPPATRSLLKQFVVLTAPPSEFRKSYPAGWSCRLEADMTCTWADGTATVHHLCGSAVSPSPSADFDEESAVRALNGMWCDFRESLATVSHQRP